MYKSHSWIVLLTLLALTACASAGSVYHPASPGLSNSVGYSDRQLSTGAYVVVFVAPQSAGAPAAQDFALLRAAELTLEKGHTWFELISTTTARIEVERPKQTFSQSEGNMTCNNGPQNMGCSYSMRDNAVGGVQVSGQAGYETRLATTLSLIMGDGAKPAGDHVYDAKETADRLRASMKQ